MGQSGAWQRRIISPCSSTASYAGAAVMTSCMLASGSRFPANARIARLCAKREIINNASCGRIIAAEARILKQPAAGQSRWLA